MPQAIRSSIQPTEVGPLRLITGGKMNPGATYFLFVGPRGGRVGAIGAPTLTSTTETINDYVAFNPNTPAVNNISTTRSQLQ
ncbi:MAG: hypothetical protein M0019_01335 [Actinomycetota bacterium]|nr:hypothetical protein [Actinomycetota bacterium]